MASTTKDLIILALKIKKGKLKDKLEKANWTGYEVSDFLKADSNALTAQFKTTNRQNTRLEELQQSKLLNGNISIQQNFVNILMKEFLNKQKQMIESVTLEQGSVNPLLAAALNINNTEDLIRYFIYQRMLTSIAGSFGNFIQKLLLYTSETIFKDDTQPQNGNTKWDLVVNRNNENFYLEIKSGPNTLNKTQINSYKRQIEVEENRNNKAYIGETYGRRDDTTVTHNHFFSTAGKPFWEDRTKIGKELWEFVSEESEYHETLIKFLYVASKIELNGETINAIIEKRIFELNKEYMKKQFDFEIYLKSLW
jgi:hypothetical protein